MIAPLNATETLPPAQRRPGGIGTALRGYGRLLRDRHFVALALIPGLTSAVLMSYVVGSPFVFREGFGLTNGQFSLMMSLNRPAPASMGSVTALLAMDQTTLTAALKPLERRGWVNIVLNPQDRRARLLSLTPSGTAALAAAVPIWKATHAALEERLPDGNGDRLRSDLANLL